MLHVVCCTLHVACCMLHVVCCMLYVACCMLHVACCIHLKLKISHENSSTTPVKALATTIVIRLHAATATNNSKYFYSLS